MPYYGCTKCHHEFEGYPSDGLKVENDWSISVNNPECDWCGAPSKILEDKTPLETMCEPDNIKKLLKELVAYDNQKSGNSR